MGARREEKKAMNLSNVKPKDQVALSDGSLVEILKVEDGQQSVLVKYIDSMGDPALDGTEASVHSDDVITVIVGTHAEGLA
jgi:hypothetical protein